MSSAARSLLMMAALPETRSQTHMSSDRATLPERCPIAAQKIERCPIAAHVGSAARTLLMMAALPETPPFFA
jgi:hypothetical protein